MIDFRYHLVSLVSVFLALAVGIILGAGPLAEPIGDTLTGQVDKLREDRNTLSNQLTQAQGRIASQDQAAEQFSERIFNNFMEGVNVALVALPGAQGDDLNAVSEKIEQAGGNVSSQITLQANFFSAAKQPYREALSGQITQYLDDTTRATTPGSTLAAAVGQLIFVGQNDSLTGILTVEDTPLIQVAKPAAEPARAAIVVGPRVTEAPSEEKAKEHEEEMNNIVEFAQTLNSFAGGAVVYGSAQGENDLLTVIRSEANNVATMDGIGTKTSLISLPFAVVARLNGTVGAWGSEQKATTLVPPFTEVPHPAPTQPDNQAPADPNAQLEQPAPQQ